MKCFIHHIPSPTKELNHRFPFHRLCIILLFSFFIISCLLLLPIVFLKIYFLSITCFINFNCSSYVLCLFLSFIIIAHLPFAPFRKQFVIAQLLFVATSRKQKIIYHHYLNCLLAPLSFTQSSL